MLLRGLRVLVEFELFGIHGFKIKISVLILIIKTLYNIYIYKYGNSFIIKIENEDFF